MAEKEWETTPTSLYARGRIRDPKELRGKRYSTVSASHFSEKELAWLADHQPIRVLGLCEVGIISLAFWTVETGYHMGLILLVGGIIAIAIAGVLVARFVYLNGTEMTLSQTAAIVFVIIIVYVQFLALLPLLWLASWRIPEQDFTALLVVGTAVGLLIFWVVLGAVKRADGAILGGLIEACYFSLLIFGLEAAVFSIG